MSLQYRFQGNCHGNVTSIWICEGFCKNVEKCYARQKKIHNIANLRHFPGYLCATLENKSKSSWTRLEARSQRTMDYTCYDVVVRPINVAMLKPADTTALYRAFSTAPWEFGFRVCTVERYWNSVVSYGSCCMWSSWLAVNFIRRATNDFTLVGLTILPRAKTELHSQSVYTSAVKEVLEKQKGQSIGISRNNTTFMYDIQTVGGRGRSL